MPLSDRVRRVLAAETAATWEAVATSLPADHTATIRRGYSVAWNPVQKRGDGLRFRSLCPGRQRQVAIP